MSENRRTSINGCQSAASTARTVQRFPGKRIVDQAVKQALDYLWIVEAQGGPNSFGGALLFRRSVEFVKAMGCGNELTNYAYDFAIVEKEVVR